MATLEAASASEYAGRVTIFSLNTCPHCKAVKALLSDLDVPYYEISLTDYPEKRTDMLQLCDRLTVPQIFFNDKHMGGNSEIQQLKKDGQLSAVITATLSQPYSPSPLLLRPDRPPTIEPELQPRADETMCLAGECYSFLELSQKLLATAPRRDIKQMLRTYKNCFTGSEFVDYLVAEFKCASRVEAVQVADMMFDSGFFRHVHSEVPFQDNDQFYRFRAEETPEVLNTYRVWSDRVEDPFLTLKHMKKRLSALQSAHMDSEGMVDYVAMAEDAEYPAFLEATCELQAIDVVRMSNTHKLAFFINLYNMMVIQAFVQVGIYGSSTRAYRFFDNVKMNIGGYLLSLNDIENGILRGNKTAPYHLRKFFSSKDPRRALSLPLPSDPRIHFALNCGAKSCPPVKNFTAEAVEEELRIVAMAFCEMDDSIRIDVKKCKVHLSKILDWYRDDFGSNSRELLQTIKQWLRGEKLAQMEQVLKAKKNPRVKFNAYDWSNNAARSKTY